jgi:RimJ/RimL family protein N-acetyltransferase
MAFIALDEDSGHMLGLVRLINEIDKKTAQFAISQLKGHGLGWLLMRRVIEHAKHKGLRHVYGDVLVENTTMLQMCAELGFHAENIGCFGFTVPTRNIGVGGIQSGHSDLRSLALVLLFLMFSAFEMPTRILLL